ncbi:MAG TPA: TlpA disulfide reductase family protein [Kofleriaceae bacterium]|jgi:thiol-disulfide isomerase/thioredoxin
MPLRKTVLLVAAASITALLGVEYLRLLKPAQAREIEAACRGLKPAPRNTALGVLPTRAPDFEAQDWSGKMVKLSDFRGKVVLLRFWGSWCETCKAEQPSLEDLAASGEDDLVVIAIASDDSWEPIRKKMPAGSNAMVLLDPPDEGAIGPIAEAYGVSAVPESVIIDREGIARYYMDNRRDWRGTVARTCLRSVLDE